MAYIGNQNPTGFVGRPPKEDFTGTTGGTLTLSNPVGNAHDIELFINHVRQEPETSYQAAGTVVTLQGYTVSATDDIYVVYKGLARLTSTVADGTIGDSKITAMSASKLTGALPAIDGSALTGLGGSNVKEVLAMLCDGGTYTVPSGTYTSQNVTAVQDLDSTHTAVTGSSVNYTPPAGTTGVLYQFNFSSRYNGNAIQYTHLKMQIDGTDITYSRQTLNAQTYLQGLWQFMYLIPIGGSANSDTGRQATWTGAKVLRLMARGYDGTYKATLHSSNHWDGAGSGGVFLRQPTVTITALG